MSKMYDGFETISPFVGCEFDCIYCKKSFQRQAKRQKHRCRMCYNYRPHFHPERLLNSWGRNKNIFLCDMGDVSFAKEEWMYAIFDKVESTPTNTYLTQSKDPYTFLRFTNLPDNLILGTTIETNLDISDISKAPPTVHRYKSLKAVGHKRKAVTIEPIRKFTPELIEWIWEIHPEVVWVGYCNHLQLENEPTLDETRTLIQDLREFTEVRIKTLR